MSEEKYKELTSKKDELDQKSMRLEATLENKKEEYEKAISNLKELGVEPENVKEYISKSQKKIDKLMGEVEKLLGKAEDDAEDEEIEVEDDDELEI